MQYFSDEQLDDMFRLLDFDQLEQLGYKMDIYTPDELEDFMITIEEEFSELDRDDKIAELRQIGAFDDDYLVDEVKMGAEEVSGDITFTARQFVDKLHDVDVNMYEDVLDTIAWEGYGRVGTWSDDELGNMILHEDESMSAETKRERLKREKEEREMDEASTDVDYMREHYAEEGSAPIQDPMEFGEMANWTPLDGSEGLKRKRAESGDISGERMTFGTIVYEGQYESPKSLDGDQIAEIEDRVEREIRSTGDGEGSLSFDIQFVDDQDEEFEVTGDVSWHHEYSDFNTAETGTYASESDAYIYAYNDGHRDGRDMSSKITYQPSASVTKKLPLLRKSLSKPNILLQIHPSILS